MTLERPEDPRYAPPRAEVADLAPALSLAEAPREVRWALRLLWVGLGLSVVAGGVGFMLLLADPSAEGSLPYLVAFTLLTAFALALTVWLILKIRDGRGWARVAYLLLWLLGAALMLMPGGEMPNSFFEEAAAIVTSLLELVALVLLFMPPARRWFQPR